MTARLVDGKALSNTVRESLMARIKAAGKPVRLDAVLVGNDRAAAIYADNQAKTCAAVGIDYRALLTRIVKLGMDYRAEWRE